MIDPMIFHDNKIPMNEIAIIKCLRWIPLFEHRDISFSSIHSNDSFKRISVMDVELFSEFDYERSPLSSIRPTNDDHDIFFSNHLLSYVNIL